MASKFALFTKGSKLPLNKGFQNRLLVTTVSRQALDMNIYNTLQRIGTHENEEWPARGSVNAKHVALSKKKQCSLWINDIICQNKKVRSK